MDVSYRKFKQELYRGLAEINMKREVSFSQLLEKLEPGQNFLDLGCGTGDLLLAAQEKLGLAGEYWGVDISGDMLEAARNKLENRGNIHLKQSDVTWGLPFADGTFHLLASIDVLQEIPSVSFLLEEIYRVLKPKGKFYLVIPCLAEDNQASRYFALLGRKYFWYFHSERELREIFLASEIKKRNLWLEFKVNQFPGFAEIFTKVGQFKNLVEEFQAMGYSLDKVKQGVFLAEGQKE